MSCEWRDRVAELEAQPAVLRHLTECGECCDLQAALRADLEKLRAAHAEPLAPSHYAAVRARVLAEVRAERRQRVWRRLWVGAAAALVAIVLMMAPRELRHPPSPSLRLEIAPLPVPPAPPLRIAAKRTPSRRRVVRHTPRVMVKLLTEDPNVVIYWIMDQQGE